MEDWNQGSVSGNPEIVAVSHTSRGAGGGVGFAVTALVLGLVSLVGLCCCAGLIDIITIPLALIFGIISLAQRRGGTGLAITGIVTAAISLLMIVTTLYSLRDILPYSRVILQDYTQLLEEQDTVFPAYEEDGTLPPYLVKYTESPYSDFFEKYDATIYMIMDALLEQYKSGELARVNASVSDHASSANEGTDAASSANDMTDAGNAPAAFACIPVIP